MAERRILSREIVEGLPSFQAAAPARLDRTRGAEGRHFLFHQRDARIGGDGGAGGVVGCAAARCRTQARNA